jgi:hypothetical protein
VRGTKQPRSGIAANNPIRKSPTPGWRAKQNQPPNPIHLSTAHRTPVSHRSLVKIQPARLVKIQSARTLMGKLEWDYSFDYKAERSRS